jgi:WD40 repeat protein
MLAFFVGTAALLVAQPQSSPLTFAEGVKLTKAAMSPRDGLLVVQPSSNRNNKNPGITGYSIPLGGELWSLQLPREGLKAGIGTGSLLGIDRNGEIVFWRMGLKPDQLIVGHFDPQTNQVRRIVRHSGIPMGAGGGLSVSASCAWACLWRDVEAKSLTAISLNDDEKRVPLVGHLQGVTGVSVSADDKKIVSVAGNEVKLWDIATGNSVALKLESKGRSAFSVFSPDGTTIVVARLDGTLSIIDVATLTHRRDVKPSLKLNPRVDCVGFLDKGKVLYVGGDNALFFFRTKDWSFLEPRTLYRPKDAVGRIEEVLVDSSERFVVLKINSPSQLELLAIPRLSD